MIVTTEAVVLSSMKYRESSRIVTLYTRAFGKLSVLAKGARDRRSKFGAALDPMSHVSSVIYKKETRELQLLSQCDILLPHRSLTKDLEKMAAGMSVIELVNAVTHAEEENAPLFMLLTGVLEAIDSATKGVANAFYYFEVRLLENLGFRPDFQVCSNCRRELDERTIGKKNGVSRVSPAGIVCPACAERGMGLETISAPALRILQRMQEISSCEAATRIVMARGVQKEVARALRGYLVTHVEGMRQLKAAAVFSAIM